jgi:hypothetical protein
MPSAHPQHVSVMVTPLVLSSYSCGLGLHCGFDLIFPWQAPCSLLDLHALMLPAPQVDCTVEVDLCLAFTVAQPASWIRFV